ncbi:MAG TPA: hypothetical protein VGM37_11055 [Armatimonadota bacterium]
MTERPLTISTGRKQKPTCPRCGSAMILIGRLTDERGDPVLFAAMDRGGTSQPLGAIRSCYCNDCGEVTLTLE